MAAEDQYQTRATLIQRVQNQQDEKSWEEFVVVYRRYIYAIIRSMNISEHDTEDILQQVLINLWNSLPKMDYEKINRFRSWLSTVTKNCVTDFIRKRTREANRLEKACKDDTLIYLKAIRLPEITLCSTDSLTRFRPLLLRLTLCIHPACLKCYK